MSEEFDELLELSDDEFQDQKGIDLDESQEGRALLVGVFSRSQDLSQCEEHLSELEDLADTFGVESLGTIAAPLKKIDASTFLTKGKLEEIAEQLKEKGATLIIFDDEITPAQQRNLETLLGVAVMDRTELILEIFAQRAQTKEAQIQVELAQTQYEFPRLKRLWSHFSRQRASGGYLKGEGEKQIEIDRRLLKKKLFKLRKELKEVQKHREEQRSLRKRSQIPTFAIVGYTNAGKSTLLNKLTNADVLTENRLFATLDPTSRKYVLPDHQEIILSDTVGFIRKLPTTLVAAFRSTLEATLHDDVLIHLIDASHPSAEEHAETTYQVLKELDVKKEAIITVLNKVDQCKDNKTIDRLRIKYPKTVVISAKEESGFEELNEAMMQELTSRRRRLTLKVPQKDYALVTQLHREGYVHYEEYEDNDVVVHADVPVSMLSQYTKYLHEDNSVEASS
jgi:GTPase